MTVTAPEETNVGEIANPLELLIEEARTESHRRRMKWFALLVVVAVATSLIVAVFVGATKPPRQVGVGTKNHQGTSVALLPCSASDVTITNGPVVSPAQEEEAHTLTLTNTGSTSCLISGFPQLVVYGSSGAVIPFRLVHHPTGDFAMTSKAPRPFALASGTSAYVLFEQFGCMVGTESTTSKVAIILPKTTQRSEILTLRRPIADCVGPSARQANPIGVSPIEPTFSATSRYHR